MSWQPIETAPKDGRSFMVWIATSDMGPHHFAPISITHDGHWFDDSTGHQIEALRTATHWHPLPPPPDKVDPGIPMYRMRKD